jgi:FkbM family methyltransferase
MFDFIYNAVRKIVRKSLLIFNIRVIKISLTEKILWQFSLKNNQVKFLQIGANDGVSFDCLYEYATTRKWSGVVVEPLIDFYNKLCINYEYFERIVPVNIAIHPYLKKFNLYRVDPKFHGELPDWARGIASFNLEHLMNNGVNSSQIILNSVPSISLMELVDQYNLYDIDYLQIDVEGMDSDIIKMIDFNKMKPKLIRFEWKHITEDEMIVVKGILMKQGYFFKQDADELFSFLDGAI